MAGIRRASWGGPEHAEPNGVIYFDAWEPYIVPATAPKGEPEMTSILRTQDGIAARVNALEALIKAAHAHR